MDIKKNKKIKIQVKSSREIEISQKYYQGYTDDKNPWRDENLTQQFFWDKKI